VQTTRQFERQPNTLLVTTCHSFKGYDAEAIVIPCVDQYTTQEGAILAANLYVAMTRARSLLAIYSTSNGDLVSQHLNNCLQDCIDSLNSPPLIDLESDS